METQRAIVAADEAWRAGMVAFVKAEANGNDFLLVAADAVPEADRAELARAICDRHRGVGADGVEFLRWRDDRLELALVNADGGAAEISGNGTRCAVAWCARRWDARELRVATGAGEKRARVLGNEGETWRIELAMGAPEFASDRIPMRLPGGPQAQVRDYGLAVGGRLQTVTALSMGNPQCCLFVADFPPDWEQLGAALHADPVFPRQANVEFVRVRDPHTLEIRIYERGVGPTQSSGTGSCAAAVAAIWAGRARSPLRVIAPGGEQEVAWEGGQGDQAGEVRLVGPARLVARGAFAWLPRSR